MLCGAKILGEDLMDVIKLYLCYARNDNDLREQLLRHLSWLIQSGQVIAWDESLILPGVNSKQEVDKHLKTSDIILLLVSPDFMQSVYSSEEMQIAFHRYEAKEARIIPVLLRPADWNNTPLGKLQALPTNRKPVTQWRDRDQAFQDVVKGIAKVVTAIFDAKAMHPIRFPTPKVTPPPLTPSEVENA
jgi:hypothetical protein